MHNAQTHRDSVVYRPLTPSHLPDLWFIRTKSYVQIMHTFHYHLHVDYQTMNNVKSRSNGHFGLLEGEPI